MQMKEQDKNTQEQINKEEITKIPKNKFLIMIVKLFQNQGVPKSKNGMDKMQVSFNTFNMSL